MSTAEKPEPFAPTPVLGRRRLMAGFGGGLATIALGELAACGPAVGASSPTTTVKAKNGVAAPQRADPSPGATAPVQAFVTRPDLRPPPVTVTAYGPGEGSPPFIFLSVRNYVAGAPSQAGLMILDRSGRLVWSMPTVGAPFDFRAQSYQGRPVLTWWQGDLVFDYGEGTGEIADVAYGNPRTVQAGGGLRADLHELQLTARGTALITAYQTVAADLSSVGGPAKGHVVAGHVQEIDLATGKLLSDWDSLGHIGLSESYWAAPKSGPYDYFHVNSIAEMPDGNLLVSAKNTSALYKLDRANGKVMWRLNGKKSDFKMGPGARFYWQHHARPTGTTGISVFDDGYAPSPNEPSRGLLLNVSTRAKEVTLERAYRHPAGFVAGSQGSVQVLPNGHVFVGWGNQNYFSEFAANGALVLDGELPLGCHSYRAYCQDWAGRPPGAPAVAARANPAGGTVVYSSWNGATEVARWAVLAGPEAASLRQVGSQRWSGFETAIAVNSAGPYFAVEAVDANGKGLGRSAAVKVGA